MSSPGQAQLAQWIWQACEWEVLAPKAGNVHPEARFEDVCAADFLRSGQILADYVADASCSLTAPGGVSVAILEIMTRIQQQIGRNTNLGIVLLLLPLAAVPLTVPLEQGIADVISGMDVSDTARLYRAIRLTQPGGMQSVAEQDLTAEPSLPVREVMQLAADRDRVARQYAFNFQDVLQFGLPCWQRWWEQTNSQRNLAITGLHLDWMAQFPDTLIARKQGLEVAQHASHQARQVLDAGWPNTSSSREQFQHFDAWLRAAGNRRNPGTSADLVAATLFASFREGLISADNGRDISLPNSNNLLLRPPQHSVDFSSN